MSKAQTGYDELVWLVIGIFILLIFIILVILMAGVIISLTIFVIQKIMEQIINKKPPEEL
ncbi:MAG: hypothetical protein A2Z78_01610 [Candidatus Nealsonbacteria bacterium RBG_13_36_15]|uniref:Uncharacterized protein n=1 Tax=Candidatus Nealsonbacteria bacterium RBG_13_36_15 TaxID=1801660 RepID=A0A1G2DUU0_9BACT|nr:MAG: hypothetical protein A2Z78_01610 [Candidatus Nealsonbacteria bacterium RBG_13_36_15]